MNIAYGNISIRLILYQKKCQRVMRPKIFFKKYIKIETKARVKTPFKIV